MKLKEQLKYYLESREMTAAQLSQKSGLSQKVLSLWFNGAEPRKLSQIKIVADTLGKSVDNLCFGDSCESFHERVEILEVECEDWVAGIFEICL